MPDAEMRFGADASNLVAAYEKAVEGDRKYRHQIEGTSKVSEEGSRRVAKGMSDVEKATKEAEKSAAAFGRAMEATLKGIAPLVAALGEGLEKTARHTKEIASRQPEAVMGIGHLAELAGGDKAKFAEYTKMADAMRASGATLSINQGADVVFKAISAHQEGALPDVQRLLQGQIVQDGAGLIKSVSAMQNAYGGKAGTFKQLLAQGLTAAAESPDMMLDILNEAAKVGPTAALSGTSSADAMTATSVLARATKSPEEAGTMMDALLRGKAKRSKPGRTIDEFIRDVEGMGMSGAELFEFMGRGEGVKAYELLREHRGDFNKTLAQVHGATNQDVVGQMYNVAMSDPRINADLLRRQAQGRAEIAAQQSAVYEQRYQANKARRDEERARGGFGERLFGGFADWAGDTVAEGFTLPLLGWHIPGANVMTNYRPFQDDKQWTLPDLPVAGGKPAGVPARPYVRAGMVRPMVPEEKDETIVEIRARMAQAELEINRRELELRETKYGRGTPQDERHIRLDRVVENNTAALRRLEVELKNAQARRRINQGSALPPNG